MKGIEGDAATNHATTILDLFICGSLSQGFKVLGFGVVSPQPPKYGIFRKMSGRELYECKFKGFTNEP